MIGPPAGTRIWLWFSEGLMNLKFEVFNIKWDGSPVSVAECNDLEQAIRTALRLSIRCQSDCAVFIGNTPIFELSYLTGQKQSALEG